MTEPQTKENLQQIWLGFHWLFFVDVQALIICLRRFENKLEVGNLNEAKVELETATNLILASGAAMRLAGSFSRKEYERQIRPDMEPPNVESENFSGLMSWDHSLLIKTFKKLTPAFRQLPAELQAQHEQFVEAYLTLSHSHRAVCSDFGGKETGSLRCNKTSAVSRLESFEKGRLKMLDPNHRVTDLDCPN